MRRLWLLFTVVFLSACVTSAKRDPSSEMGARDGSSYVFTRVYTPGEHYSYNLKATTSVAGVWQETGVAAADISVVYDQAVSSERVVWKSYEFSSAKDGRHDESAYARQVKPYVISLNPRGSLALPELWPEEMKGMLADLNTFYVAVSPQRGVQKVRRPGDKAAGDAAIGNWGGSEDNPMGQDCTEPVFELVALDARIATYRTTFVPPAAGCPGFTMLKDWMTAVSTDGLKNNFYQVLRKGGLFTVTWGVERFTVESKVDRATGRVLGAHMDNDLDLKTRGGCDEKYENCGEPQPLAIHRELDLELDLHGG